MRRITVVFLFLLGVTASCAESHLRRTGVATPAEPAKRDREVLNRENESWCTQGGALFDLGDKGGGQFVVSIAICARKEKTCKDIRELTMNAWKGDALKLTFDECALYTEPHAKPDSQPAWRLSK